MAEVETLKAEKLRNSVERRRASLSPARTRAGGKVGAADRPCTALVRQTTQQAEEDRVRTPPSWARVLTV